jgi:hypothetical protein
MRAIAISVAQALLALSCLAPAWAPVWAPAWAGEPLGTGALLWDNDSFFSDDDLHYTNGLGLAWLWAPGREPAALARLADALPPAVANAERRVGFAIGQSMFTPQNLERSDLILDDQPYAGWLYVALAALSYRERPRGPVAGDLESFEIVLGVVGPDAFAGDVQTSWHEFMEITRPSGWDHQLHNEPGLVLAYTRQWRFCADLGEGDCRSAESGAASIDWIPYLGGTLGNVYTYLAAGATLRLGEGLGSDFNHSRIRPGLPVWSWGTPADGFNWHVFASAEGRLVGRNIFLDGNTFRDSHSVSKKPLVGDFEIGFTVSWDILRPISVTYRHLVRTPEFDGQRGIDNIDSLNIAVSF